MTNFQALAALGWAPFFQQQLSLDEWQSTIPARVIEQHKSQLRLLTDEAEFTIGVTPGMPPVTVGDWLLLNQQHQFERLLDRLSLFKRKSAGTGVGWQLIAANVDTAFIVSSMNDDFNLSRIERYLSLIHSADVEPVVVLTKCDLVESPDKWLTQVAQLDENLSVVAVNARDAQSRIALSNWLKPGKTVVVLGSSGVGKSTLANTLLGKSMQTTQAIRQDDAKGRHTTTGRAILTLPDGGLILDTPGMRELQLADCQEGITSAFADIQQLAQHCRFADCQHGQEPDCALRQAVERGELEARRLSNYIKLLSEDAHNSATLAEKRAREKAFTRYIQVTQKESRKLRGR